MIKQAYIEKLNVGDTIVVAEGSSFLRIGFFAGYGRGTFQFYTPSSVVWYDKQEKQGNKPRFWKSYVQSTHKYRVMKIDDKGLEFEAQEHEQEYWTAKQVLINKGIIKN